MKILLVIIFLVYWIGLIPGIRGANDFPYVFNEAVKVGFNLPYVWSPRGSEGLGQYVVSTLWAYPMDLLYGLGSNLGFDFWLLERVIGILPILLLGFFGMSNLLEYYKITGWAKSIGVFFFLTNTYILLLIDGGQLSIGLSYTMISICFLLWIRAIKGNFRNYFFAALSTTLLGFFDIRFVYIFFMLLFFYFLFQLFFEIKSIKEFGNYLKKYLQTFVLFLIFFTGLNLYWILPLLLAKASFLPPTYTRESQLSFLNFANIGHGLLLQQPHWYQNIFGQISNLKGEFLLLPMMVFLAAFLKRKDKTIGFWLLVSLLGIFLIKGSNPPFGNVYKWIFNNIPGFSLFRDSTKFFVFVCLGYSVLIATFIQEITKLNFRSLFLNRLIKIVPLLVLIYLILLANPAYLDKMSGLLSFLNFQNEYLNQAKYLENDKSFSKVLWIPRKAPLGFSSPNHPVLEAFNLLDKRPFAVGVNGSYELFNFLRDAPFSGQLFDITGVGYLSFSYLDSKREEVNEDKVKYYYTFLDQIKKLAWIDEEVKDSSVPLLKTKIHQEQFFLTQNNFWVIGSDSLYNESTKSASLSLSKNALIFTEEFPGLINRIDETAGAKVILNNKTKTDLAAAFLVGNDLIFPAKRLNFDPDKSGWWKRETEDLLFWKDFLSTKYGIKNQDFDLKGGWAVAEGHLSLEIKDQKLLGGKILLARMLESSRSGKVTFSQGNEIIGNVKTLNTDNKSNIHWFEVGNLVSSKPLLIITDGDINVLNSLAIIDKNIWEEKINQANNLSKRISDFSEQNISSSSAKLSFSKINPTKYIVSVSGLSAPQMVVFAQNYDPLWKMNGKESVPVYSMLNGFVIEQDGEYIVEYEAQKYVYPGLAISVLTVLTITFFFHYLKRRV